MDYLQFIETMSPAVYSSLVRAVELSKWPDGKTLTQEQRANAMHAIIAWGERHLTEQDRVGYVVKKPRAAQPCDTPQSTPLKWQE